MHLSLIITIRICDQKIVNLKPITAVYQYAGAQSICRDDMFANVEARTLLPRKWAWMWVAARYLLACAWIHGQKNVNQNPITAIDQRAGEKNTCRDDMQVCKASVEARTLKRRKWNWMWIAARCFPKNIFRCTRPRCAACEVPRLVNITGTLGEQSVNNQ
jgi:hypothetical protein